MKYSINYEESIENEEIEIRIKEEESYWIWFREQEQIREPDLYSSLIDL